MKRIIICTVLICVFFACSTSYYAQSVNFISNDVDTITLRCSGVGSNKHKARENAEINAIKALLFRGIPNSQQKEPLVSISEKDALEKHQLYFDKLLDEGRYKTFLLSNIPVTEAQRKQGNIWEVTIDVRINLYGLRTDLEYHNVIRKFGF